MFIEEAKERFAFHCKYEKNLDGNTLRAYNTDMRQFLNRHSIKEVQDIDKVLLKNYIEFLYKNDYKIKTIKRKIAVLKAFFNYLEFDDLILANPFRKLKLSLKEPKILPETLELNEVEIILKFLHKNKAESKNSTFNYKILTRDLIVTEMLFSTGVRVSELSNLKKKDVNLNTGIIKIFGKGSKERIIQICDEEVLILLREYSSLFKLDEKSSESYFLLNKLGNRLTEQSIRLNIHKYRKEIGLSKHITPHVFRHTFATLLLEEGVDIRYIQNMLGHSTISTTQIYTQVSMKHQRKILDTKHPRKNLNFSNNELVTSLSH